MNKISQILLSLAALFTVSVCRFSELERWAQRVMNNYIKKTRYGEGSIPILDPFFVPLKEPLLQHKLTKK